MTKQMTKQTTIKDTLIFSLEMNDEMGNQFACVSGNVPHLLEYQKDKILMVVGKALMLYDSWDCIREIKIDLQDNFFTMVRKGSVRPYG